MRLFLLFILVHCISCKNSDIEVIAIAIDKTTIPEGIAIEPNTKDIFISSLHLDQLVRYNTTTNKPKTILNRKDQGYSIGVGLDIFENKIYALACYDRDSFLATLH